MKIGIVAPDDKVQAVVDTIIAGPHRPDRDGKIFVYPVAEVIRIRTGERGKVRCSPGSLKIDQAPGESASGRIAAPPFMFTHNNGNKQNCRPQNAQFTY